jgi:hypothetical protein
MLRAIDRERVVLLSPDAAEYFPDEQSVNTALRALIQETKGRHRGARVRVASEKFKVKSCTR